MAKITTTFNAAELRALLESPTGPVADDLRRRGQRVLNRARTLIRVDTGRARASLTMVLMKDANGLFVRVGSPYEYVRYLNDGTGIYGPRGTPIRPVSARFLRWPAVNNSGSGPRRYVGGATAQYIFARQVRGIKGDRFLERALHEAGGS